MSSKKQKKDKNVKHEDEPMHTSTNDNKFEDGDDSELMEFDEEFEADMDMESEAIHGLDDGPSEDKDDKKSKTKDKGKAKDKKSTSEKHSTKHKKDDHRKSEKETKSKSKDKDKGKRKDRPDKRSKKVVMETSEETELDSGSDIAEDSELDGTSKAGPGKKRAKKGKAPLDKEKMASARRKTKPVREPRGRRRKPMTARKLPLKLTGVARKLPIEEAEEDVQIDWSFDDTAIQDPQIADFQRGRIEEKYRYLEREKINLENEFVYMKTDLDQKTKLITELKADYDRLRSDFDNYKKRMRSDAKEKQKFAAEKLVSELLEVLDNFDRTNQLDINTADKEDILKGIQLIQNQMLDILGKEGLKTITAKGEPFDPYIHDAVTTSDTDDHPHNTVLEDLQKGYKFKGKVLRPSKVRVSQSEINPPIPIKREKKKEEKKMKEKTKVKVKDKKKDKEVKSKRSRNLISKREARKILLKKIK